MLLSPGRKSMVQAYWSFTYSPTPKWICFWCTAVSPFLVVLPGFPVELLCQWSAVWGWEGSFLLAVRYGIFPETMPTTQTCCFLLLVLPSLLPVKHDCIWTNSFIKSLIFLSGRHLDLLSTRRWNIARKEGFWLSISGIIQTGWLLNKMPFSKNLQEQERICSTEGLKLFLKKLV